MEERVRGRAWRAALASAVLAVPAGPLAGGAVEVGGFPLPAKEAVLWARLGERLARLEAGRDGVLGLKIPAWPRLRARPRFVQ